ncbi:MAG: tetratricopeptide repeat protein [Acidobacteriota bacterium]
MTEKLHRVALVAAHALVMLIAATPGAQSREYHVMGKVVDKDRQPVGGAEIKIRDQGTGRTYAAKTKGSGEFELVGLPHGVLEATIQKKGYAAKTDEWNFETPQEKMRKVELPEIVLLTDSQQKEIELSQELQRGVQRANEKIRVSDFDGALELLEDLLVKKPEDTDVLYLSGICYLKKQEVDAAIAALEEVTAAKPDFAAAHLQLGMSHQQSNDRAKALESYRKVLELEPQNLAALYNMGVLLYAENKPEDALPYLERAIEIKKDDSEIHETTAYCHLQLGNQAKALECLERAQDYAQDMAKIEALETLIEQLKEQMKQ